MSVPDDYVPFGPEWEREVMKMGKPAIIGMLRSELMNNQTLPDLLEALKNLLPIATKLIDEAYDRGEMDYPSGNISEVIHAQATIAKATGKEPA